MATAIQKSALNKLKGQWVPEATLDDLFGYEGVPPDERDIPPPHMRTPAVEPIEMTKSEAEAWKGCLIERGLSEQLPKSAEDLVPGQFIIEEGKDNIKVTLDKRGTQVEHFPKPKGDIQSYTIMLHRDDFEKLQIEFLREGWFSRDNAKEQGRHS
jgi:hypothetical protein